MNIIVESVNALLYMYIGYVYFSTFSVGGKTKPLISLILNIVYSIILTVSLLLFKGTLLLYIPMIAVTVAISLMFNSKIINKILCSCLYLAINSIVEVLVSISISTVFQTGIEVFRNYSPYHIYGMLISKFIVFLIILFIRIKKQNTLLRQFKGKYLSVFLIPISTLILTALQCALFVKYPDQDVIIKIFIIISYTLLIVANIIVFDFIDSLYKNLLYESKLNTADEIISSQTQQYQAFADYSNDLMKIRHDHRNFCIGMITMLKSGDIESAIHKISSELDLCSDDSFIPKNTIQTLIDIKSREASSKNIKLEYACHGLNNIKISSIDLSIIVGNALDNAIEACERIDCDIYKEISISVIVKNNNIVINIKNPTSENIDINNLITSKKHIKGHHGIGIISMRKIADKYSGEVVFKCEDKLFTTTIVISNTN